MATKKNNNKEIAVKIIGTTYTAQAQVIRGSISKARGYKRANEIDDMKRELQDLQREVDRFVYEMTKEA